MWNTKYKNTTVREWVWHLHRSGDLRSNHRLVWLKRVGGRRHAGVYTKGPATPRRIRRRPESESESACIEFLLASPLQKLPEFLRVKILLFVLCSIVSWSFGPMSFPAELWVHYVIWEATEGQCYRLKSEGCFKVALSLVAQDLKRSSNNWGICLMRSQII